MSNPRLLIIEDNADVAGLVSHIAAMSGFDVRIVGAGSDVVPVYDEFDPQVIVLDIFMPEMDGFEVLRFLHTCKSEAHVVILSGDSDFRPMAVRMANGLALDIAADLEKPFRARELVSALETIKFSLCAEAEPTEAPDAKISA